MLLSLIGLGGANNWSCPLTGLAFSASTCGGADTDPVGRLLKAAVREMHKSLWLRVIHSPDPPKPHRHRFREREKRVIYMLMFALFDNETLWSRGGEGESWISVAIQNRLSLERLLDSQQQKFSEIICGFSVCMVSICESYCVVVAMRRDISLTEASDPSFSQLSRRWVSDFS